MKPQKINITHNKPTGRFITKEDKNQIKESNHDIENVGYEIPQWERDLINSRLEAIEKNPERLRPIEELYEELNRKI